MKKTRFNWQKIFLSAIAFIVATVAWIYVNSGQRIEKRKTIKIQYVQMPVGLSFQRTPVKEFSVLLKGSLYRLRKIRDGDLVFLIDLSSAKAGTFRVDIDLDDLRIPLDIEARAPQPRSFYVHLEQIYTRDVPVRPMYLGKVKEGFFVSRIRIVPETLSITGPQSVISKLNHIDIEVPLMNKDSSFSIPAIRPKINLPETEALDPVAVEIEIAPVHLAKELRGIAVVAEPEDPRVSVYPPQAAVTIEGTASDMTAISSQIRVRVPVAGLGPGRYRVRGRLELPPGVKLVSLEPKTFMVEVKR